MNMYEGMASRVDYCLGVVSYNILNVQIYRKIFSLNRERDTGSRFLM